MSKPEIPSPIPVPEAPPPLPENATPEEIDRHWLQHVYQGDHQPQLTFRAVMMGGVLGMLMALSNLYTTLKIGWSFGVAITACVLSYVLWNAIRALFGGRLTQISLLENNCMQSTASAAGYSTGSTVGTAFGALLLITGEHQPWKVLVPYVILTAALGVFVAIPMKRRMINYEKLPFPSGIAAAETLRSLYAHGLEALHKAYALIAALAIGGLIGLFRNVEALAMALAKARLPHRWLEWLPKIPDSLALPAFLNRANMPMNGFSFDPGVLMIGAGMLVGLRVSFWMFFSSAVLHIVLVPLLLQYDALHAGLANYVPALQIKGGAITPPRWALWGGTSVMVFASLTALALMWPTLVRAFRQRREAGDAQSDPVGHLEVPGRWLILGMIPITIGMVILQYLAFHINPILGLIAVAMSFVVALVCCRAAGETDTSPIGAMGKLTQLVYAALPWTAGNTTVNLAAAGMTASAGGSASDLLTDLKSGYLLGANPRKQFLAQFFGVFFGTLAVVPAWYLMVPDQATLEAMHPPAASMWQSVALLLEKGTTSLPAFAALAIMGGAVIGVLLPLSEWAFPKARPYLPSAMGLGLGWVIFFNNAFSFLIGAIIVALWLKWQPRQAERFSVPIASGFVAGESVVAAVITILCTLLGLIFKF